MRKLQESTAHVRGAEAKVGQLELSRSSDREEQAALEKKLQDLNKILVSADETNDQLQADLEVKDEDLARLAGENAQNFSSSQTFQKERLDPWPVRRARLGRIGLQAGALGWWVRLPLAVQHRRACRISFRCCALRTIV